MSGCRNITAPDAALASRAKSVRRRERPVPGGAFSLIELLVVVAIIALLISLLLPSMAKAREQAKTVKCVSNLRQIGVAMTQYFQETNEWFPFARQNVIGMLHGFYYGGHPGRRLPHNQFEWWGYVWEQVRDTPAGRPFNRYLYPELPNWDVPPENPLFEVVRQLPVFECPSDSGGFWQHDAGDVPIYKSLYWQTGSSYTMNYHLAWRWAWGFFRGTNPNPWLWRANAFLQRQLRSNASTFVILYEDPMDSALWLGLPRRGWHRGWNRHSVLFLDAHAANMLTDTARGSSGPGWKTSSGHWFLDPNDPDYRYRDLPPLPGTYQP